MEAKFADVPDEVWKYVEPWLPDPVLATLAIRPKWE